MKLKLFGAVLSPFLRKARILFAEKGLEYDLDPSIMPGNFPDWYVEMHPLKRIPSLQIGEGEGATIIPDSSAVCVWAEKTSPEPSFYPSSAEDYAKAVWLEEFSDTGFAEAVGLNVFRPILFNFLAKKEPDMEQAQKGLARVRELMAYLEKQISPAGFLVGSALSIADVAVVSQLINLSYVGYTIQESDAPKLCALYQQTIQRPSVATLGEQERGGLEKMGFQAPTFA